MFVSNTIKKIKLAARYPKNTLRFITNKFSSGRVAAFPELITLFVTSACNFKCPMCENSIYRNEVVSNQNITVEEVIKILPELKKYKPFVYIVGGEPLLNSHTIEIIKLLSQNGIFTSMTSNGFLLADNAQALSGAGLEFISLSLDHYQKELHDAGRGVAGAYDHLLAGLDILNQARLKNGRPSNIKINTVIRKDNFSQLSAMYDFVESLGVDEWSLSHFSFKTPEAIQNINEFKAATGIGDNSLGLEISGNEYLNDEEIAILREQLELIAEKNKWHKLKSSVPTQISDLRKYYSGISPSKKSFCLAPFNSIQIHAGCKVKAGCLDTEIGNFENGDSLLQIWNSPKNLSFQKLIRDQKVIPPCFRCHALTYKW